MNDKLNVRPSIGIMPEKLWLEQRCQELSRAIADRLENPAHARQECLRDWTAELERHLDRIRIML